MGKIWDLIKACSVLALLTASIVAGVLMGPFLLGGIIIWIAFLVLQDHRKTLEDRINHQTTN